MKTEMLLKTKSMAKPIPILIRDSFMTSQGEAFKLVITQILHHINLSYD